MELFARVSVDIEFPLLPRSTYAHGNANSRKQRDRGKDGNYVLRILKAIGGIAARLLPDRVDIG